MRRNRALFAVLGTMGTVLLVVIGLGDGELYHARAAEGAHARALMNDLGRSEMFQYFPSAYELQASEIEPLSAQF